MYIDNDVTNSIRYRKAHKDKDDWICKLCNPFCEFCNRREKDHENPNSKCNSFESKGLLVLCRKGEMYWIDIDYHMMKIHKDTMIHQIRSKYIERIQTEFGENVSILCKLCGPEGRELKIIGSDSYVSYRIWLHVSMLHLHEALLEMRQYFKKMTSYEGLR